MTPEIPPDPTIPRRQYEEAVSLMAEGHYEEALPILSRLWAIRPIPPFGLARGRCLVALGRYVEAVETFESTERATNEGSRWASLHDVVVREEEEARGKIVVVMAPTHPKPEPTPEPTPRRVPWYGWVTGAGAVAGVGAFGGIELVAAHDDRRGLQPVAIAALSVGVVLAVATAVVVVTEMGR